MRDIKNLNIWKEKTTANKGNDAHLDADIVELSLSVRAYNCLKRAGCNTVRDIIDHMGEDGQGLKKIRNLGNRSECEILEKIEEIRAVYASYPVVAQESPARTIIKPARRIWDMDVAEFNLSDQALLELHGCGIRQIRDLYRSGLDYEPGWFAVRELFDKIPRCR